MGTPHTKLFIAEIRLAKDSIGDALQVYIIYAKT